MNQSINRLLAGVRACAAISAAIILLLIVAVISIDLAPYASILLGFLALIAIVHPFPKFWIENRQVATLVLIVAFLSFFAALKIQDGRRVAAQLERWNHLRQTDVPSYLAELRAAKDQRWEAEFEELDKNGYEKFLAERRLAEEAAKKEEISKLKSELIKTPNTEIDSLYRINDRLSHLEPNDSEHRKKASALLKQITERNRKRDAEREQLQNPENYVKIENFSWSKDGFDTVMVANFSIANKLPWAVKDIVVRCIHDAPSGTRIDTNTRTIYERIEAKQTKRINRFSMGFIHSQAARSGCDITKVVVLN